jgi:hypothetical protein
MKFLRERISGAIVSGLVWMLLAWPLIIRRFFSDRQFADLLAGDHAPVHRRSPDAGLTWLGWLLIAQGALTASFVITQLIMGLDGGGGGGFGHHRGGGDFAEMFSIFGSAGVRSIWWSIGLLALQAWAGFELIRMSPQSRIIASVFGVVGTLVTLYAGGPAMHQLEHLTTLPNAQTTLTLGGFFLASILPPTTLILVNRNVSPTARARFRT